MRGLVGAGGVLELHPCSLHYAREARALPSRLALCPRGSRYALAAAAAGGSIGSSGGSNIYSNIAFFMILQW
jgi:hypothetical protein